MDIVCQICGDDFLFYELEFVRPGCKHLLHQSCIEDNHYICPMCGLVIDENEPLEPVAWNELDRLLQDCSKLQEILAEHVADVSTTNRSQAIPWMHDVTAAVTRVEYPSILIQRIKRGITAYKQETESLYNKDDKDELVNFGIPIRFNDKTNKGINAVRRCIIELNKWMELEFNGSNHFKKWDEDLQQFFPNLDIIVPNCYHIGRRKKICSGSPYIRY